MVPYDCDALLPIEERYLSTKYRRLSRKLDVQHMLWDEAVELVAWVQFLGGPREARGLMQWTLNSLRMVERLLENPKLVEAAKPYLAANYAQVTIEDGLKMFWAMRDGYLARPKIPIWVRMSLAEDRHRRGITLAAHARELGVAEHLLRTRELPKTGRVPDAALVGLSFG